MLLLHDFVGQENIILQALSVIFEDVWSILLRGKYGYGKTTLAIALATAMSICTYSLPVMDSVDLSDRSKVHIIDEAHLMKTPELMYPYMSSGRFIFCSNMAGELPDPFLSRVYQFRMEDYSNAELAQIVGVNTGAPASVAAYISTRCKGNPRTAVELGNRLIAYSKFSRQPLTVPLAAGIFGDVFGIDDNGFDEIDRNYIKMASRPISKRTLALALDISYKELERRERFLIQKGLLRITSKGRIVNGSLT